MSRNTLHAMTFFARLRQRAVVLVLALAVFNHPPNIMNSPTISLEDRNHLLAYAIPALSPSIGSVEVTIDTKLTSHNIAPWKRNNWPRTGDFILNDPAIIWCHSDFMLVPHFHTHMLFDNMKIQINPTSQH